jgi:hypothetical protein
MIYYKLDTKLTGTALDKMQETIPPLMEFITNLVDSHDTVEDIISDMKENLPYNTSNWIEHDWVPEYEVHLHLNRSGSFGCHAIFDFKDVVRDIRDMKIKKLLE